MEGTMAEIRLFAGNFAPKSWSYCNGTLMSISTNTALFSLLGTTYGGNGQTTFALPDFRGRVAFGTGQGAGLSSVTLGEMAGTPNVTLISTNLPPHNHILTGGIRLNANADASDSGTDPSNRKLSNGSAAYSAQTPNTGLAPIPISGPTTVAGSSAPINIMPPYLGLNYIICIYGIFPSRP